MTITSPLLRLFLLCVLLGHGLLGSALAQGASVLYFGRTCGRPAPYGSPTIYVPPPLIGGNSWAVYGNGMRAVHIPNACHYEGRAFLALGTSRTHWGGLSLPALLPLSVTDHYPCLLQVSPELFLEGGLDGAGAILPSRIPNDPSLNGARIYAQWCILYYITLNLSCPFWTQPHWVTSDAAELFLGY